MKPQSIRVSTARLASDIPATWAGLGRIRTALLASVTVAASALSGCAEPAPDTTLGHEGAALTAEQCTYFAVNDKVTYCHAANLKKAKYVLIRTDVAGCVNGHADHEGDFISLDGTCDNSACFPVGSPWDSTVSCCDNMHVVGGACACLDGFASADGATCVDVDECSEGLDNCDANATCANTEGSFTCTCDAGYSGDGTTCTDIDECAEGLDNCGTNATCTNTEGAFTCACDAGFAGDGVTCVDIDECAEGLDNCDANATCANTEGAFTCTCNEGYAGDGVTCGDVDECAEGFANCDVNAMCTNTPGSFTCECKSGYRGNGLRCNDIDECTEGLDNCDTNATCTNAPGTFTCACNPGFNGDGLTCQSAAFCGDGVVNQVTELCDRGALNGVPGSGCQNDCSLEPDVDLSARIHEHCSSGSISIEFTQDTATLNWPTNLNRPSYVTLGPNTGIILYSGYDFTGQQITLTSNVSFCGLSYPDGSGVNDRVLSFQLFYVP